MDTGGHEGLSIGYRIGWRLRYLGLSIFGPAQLGADDPQVRLRRERERKVAAARAARLEHQSRG